MRKSLAITFASLLFASTASAEDAAKKGLEIAIKLDDANKGFESEEANVTMTLINAHGDTVERKMTLLTLEMKKDGDKSIVTFVKPADVKGTRLLTWTHKKGDDDQWLYMPAIKRIKRISSRNKSGSFMGSEFAYEDISSQEVEKYTYKFLEDTKLDNRDVWKMERYPVDKRSGYTRQIVWADKEYMNAVKVEYYDRKNELLKTAIFSEYKKIGKLWRVGKIDMNNNQTKKRSIFAWDKRKLGVDLDPEDFESESLEDI